MKKKKKKKEERKRATMPECRRRRSIELCSSAEVIWRDEKKQKKKRSSHGGCNPQAPFIFTQTNTSLRAIFLSLLNGVKVTRNGNAQGGKHNGHLSLEMMRVDSA